MPTLWADTVQQHRQAVRDGVLAATAALISEQGLAAVTMSGIADRAGIGRATLYNHFADLDAVLVAWHERQIGAHLAAVMHATQDRATIEARIETALETYAVMAHTHGNSELGALLHQRSHAVAAHHHLLSFLGALLAEGAAAGVVRDDVPPPELAAYCVSSLSAASTAHSNAAVRRLVRLTLDGAKPPQRP